MPLCALERTVCLVDLFELVVAVDLRDQDTAVVTNEQQVRVCDAGADDSGLSASFLIKHWQDLSETKICIC